MPALQRPAVSLDEFTWRSEIARPRDPMDWTIVMMAPLLVAAGLPKTVRATAIAKQSIHGQRFPKVVTVGIAIGAVKKLRNYDEIQVSFAAFDQRARPLFWSCDLDPDGGKSAMVLFDGKYLRVAKEISARLRALAPRRRAK